MANHCCSHEAHHDDDHIKPGEGTQGKAPIPLEILLFASYNSTVWYQDFLYSKIALDRVTGFNVDPQRPAKSCIKPWSDRSDDTQYTESDMDQQMIIHVPFTGSVKLRTVILRTLPGPFRPTQAHLFVNQPDLDFDTIESKSPTQVLEIPETSEIIEFPVRVAKFSAVTSLSIFFNSTIGDVDKSRIYFLGFKGEFTNVSRKPVIAIYEAQANPNDHQKIPGLNDSMHSAM